MIVRRFFLTVLSFSFLVALPPRLVRADDATSPDVETARHNFIGEVNGNSVFVRSAPREDAYPTMKLDRGARVTVVGIKFKFLKILPPEGSFAYVQKAYINKRGSGNIGRASREIIAKSGSMMNQLKTSPMGKIDDGQDVEIVGEQDEWYKIKPPTGSFCYISQSYVSPVQALPTETEKSKPEVVVNNTTPDSTPAVVKHDAASTPPLGDSDTVTTTTPTPGNNTAAPAPAPVAPAPTEEFAALEGKFKAASEMLIADQPVEELLAGYQELAKQNSLDSQAKQIASIRVKTLELRAKSKLEFIALRTKEAEDAEQRKARTAEREEITQRIKERQVTFYAVVGTLRASSIQNGPGTLFRMTDPATGRSIAYVRITDTKQGKFLGQFVGIKGMITTDTGLKIKIIEQPTLIETVDPAKVSDSVAAQIVPPSMMPGQASVRPGAE